MNTPIEIIYGRHNDGPGSASECHWNLEFQLAVKLHFTGIEILLDE
jgi:hypothetical protein